MSIGMSMRGCVRMSLVIHMEGEPHGRVCEDVHRDVHEGVREDVLGVEHDEVGKGKVHKGYEDNRGEGFHEEVHVGIHKDIHEGHHEVVHEDDHVDIRVVVHVGHHEGHHEGHHVEHHAEVHEEHLEGQGRDH